MYIYLSHPSFAHSVAALETDVLKRQRHECLRLICCLNAPNLAYARAVHPNHFVERWIGYPGAIETYFTFVLWELENRGVPATYVSPYQRDLTRSPGWPGEIPERMVDVKLPPFIGEDLFHAGVRKLLARNSPDWTPPAPEATIVFKPDTTPHAKPKPKQLEMF